MNIIKKTAIIISLITSTTGFAVADGHEAPGSGYWSTVSQELKEGKSGTIQYRVTKDIWDTPNAPDGWPKGGSGNCYQTLIFATGEQNPSFVHNTCHSIDPQGDAAVYIGKFDPTIGKFTGGFVSGTGKYAGLAPANLIFEGVDFDQTSGKYTWTSANQIKLKANALAAEKIH